jgi:hypothetical protein
MTFGTDLRSHLCICICILSIGDHFAALFVPSLEKFVHIYVPLPRMGSISISNSQGRQRSRNVCLRPTGSGQWCVSQKWSQYENGASTLFRRNSRLCIIMAQQHPQFGIAAQHRYCVPVAQPSSGVRSSVPKVINHSSEGMLEI